MKHVFVESNWVFEYVMPEFKRKPSAGQLVTRAARGELVLHVPAICLREGAESVRRKCQPRHELAEFRRFASARGLSSPGDAEIVQRFLQQFHEHVTSHIERIDERLDELVTLPNVRAFALSQAMLDRVLDLRRRVIEIHQLRPYDEAILAAVLEQAKRSAAKARRRSRSARWTRTSSRGRGRAIRDRSSRRSTTRPR